MLFGLLMELIFMSFPYSFWNSRLHLKNLTQFSQTTDLFFRHHLFNKMEMTWLYAEDIVLQRSCVNYSVFKHLLFQLSVDMA